MKVLFLPYNIASMQAITSDALNKIPGVESKCINIQPNKYSSDNYSVISIAKRTLKSSSPFSSFCSLPGYLNYRKQLLKWIKWADILHYVWGPALDNGWDVKVAMKLRKPIFIEWVGSDIRNPEFLSGINSYYKKILGEGYEYKDIEASNYKEQVQLLFFEASAIPTLAPEMSLFVDKKKFPSYIEYPSRVNVREFKPNFPDITNARPHIIHSPSVKVGKGSNVIIRVIEELKEEYDFEFTLVHDMKREDALAIMRKADIFIDQIIIGGYGMSSCEAMAFGKPVVTYILPEVFDAGLPYDCPIVNANPDNLKEKLTKLIKDPVLRNEIGKKSRLFVERYSDANNIALKLVEIYTSAIEGKKAKTSPLT